jgi:hypothetical protein
MADWYHRMYRGYRCDTNRFWKRAAKPQRSRGEAIAFGRLWQREPGCPQ